MSEWVEVCGEDELPVGGWKTVELDDAEVLVVRLEDGFHAIEDVCTHDGGCLAGGDIEGHEVVCPRHGARFDLLTGEATAPPAYEPVHVFPVKVEGGRVYVRDDRWD